MPNLTTGYPQRTGDLEKDYDNLREWAISFIDELKVILCNLDCGNVSEAASVQAQNIDISKAKIKDAQINSLTADKLTAGTIDAGEINIASEDESYTMNLQGDSLIFADGDKIRIAMGRNSSTGKYIFTVQNADGTAGIYMNEDGELYMTGILSGAQIIQAESAFEFLKPSGSVGAQIYYDDSRDALVLKSNNIILDGAISS